MCQIIQLSDYIPRKAADHERYWDLAEGNDQCPHCGGQRRPVARIGNREVVHCGCRATMRPVEAK